MPKSVPLHVRLSVEDKAAVEELAIREGRKTAVLLRALVQEALASRARKAMRTKATKA